MRKSLQGVCARSLLSVVAVILLFTASHAARAAEGTATGTIQYMYTYGNGMVLVTGFSFSPASCTNNGGFVIYHDHPHFKTILAVLMSAKATGATVSVVAKVDNCWYPEMTSSPSTYFVVFPN